ncbi:Lrp/AsnC family transcriptional regulator [Ahniella affigens]|uniref:Lrp/AsnC family transcriptional regulator n=1 Tax=Ahniella affigens TaxID=2021234 RepID=UPI001F0B9665|nr:Lrp/AsnC family transcriptional regulator [Ahniella affigens]
MLALDRIDYELLRLLRKNARMPNKDLAERVGVAASTCLERVRRMREAGVIKGFHAELEPDAIGCNLQAMISIRLVVHAKTQVTAFHDHLLQLPEVLGFFHVAGANDFLVHVGVADSAALRRLVLESFTTRPEVAHVETNLIFEFRRNTDLPTTPPHAIRLADER